MKRCSDGMQNKGGQKVKVNIQGTIPTSEFLSGVRVGGGWQMDLACSPLDREFYLHVNQLQKLTQNYVRAKTVLDFTKLHLIKGPKSKLHGGTCPQTSLVCHIFCTRIHTCPPNNPYNLILPPPPTALGKN